MLTAEGRNEDAIGAYLNAAIANPDNIQPLQQAGRLYAQTSSPAEVIQWLDGTAEQQATLADTAGALAAQILVQQGDIAGAEQRLASLQTGNTYVDTVKVEALTARAAAAARQQDWAGARTNMAEAISLQPENLNLQLSLARILASSEQSDDARALLDDLESEQGRDARITLTRAQVIRISEGLEPSYQYLRAEWEQAGESALMPALLQLAQQAEPEASVALATSWTVQHPENPTAWIALGDRNLQQDQELDAASNYREALRLQPGNIAAMNNLAWLLQDSDPIEAVMLARQAAERAPQNAAILDTYGRVLYKAGNILEALTTLERALELDPENAEIQQHLNEAKAQQ
jgi:tetratricopeptide (TPR) repeat protein